MPPLPGAHQISVQAGLCFRARMMACSRPPPPTTRIFITVLPYAASVMEQPQPAESHGDAVLVAGVDDLLVPDGPAGLDDGGDAAAAGPLDVVPKGEECVRPQADAGDVAEVLLLFLGGQGLGRAADGLGQDVFPDDVLGGVPDVDVDGVVPVGLGHVVPEGQVQHLVHVAQLPVVGLLAGQAGAVDAALLAGAHADG